MKKQITLLIACLFSAISLAVAQQTVTGTVKDSKGEVLLGVTIRVKGSTTGVSTGINGTYSISAPSDAVLVASSISYVTQEQPVSGRSTVDFILVDDKTQLQEVVVIGYGTAQKKDVTGAVSSVRATQLENENPQSVADILRGNIAGLNVSYNSSAKGGGDLLVRGKTTLSASTSPLIVLDGVIYIGQLSDINPNDIETVDVLKDASSLAVYGAKAATGVVAITTKKGRAGAAQISLNSNVGLATMSVNQNVYDGPGFLKWRGDVARSGGTTPAYIYLDPNNLPAGVTLTQWLNGQTTTNPTDLWLTRLGLVDNEKANYLAGKTTDWYDLLFRDGKRQDHTASLSGRKEDVTYYMSLGYQKNENLIEGGDFSSFRSRVNLEGKAAKFLTVGMNLQFANRNEGAIEADWGQLVNLSPYGDFYNANGTIRRIPTDDNGLNARNPFLATTYNSRLQKQGTVFGSLYAKAALPFGITYSLNFSPGYDSYRTFNAGSSLNPEVTTPGGTASRATETRYNWQIDNLLKWNKTFANIHNVDVTLLANAEKYQTWYTIASNTGFVPSDILGYHNLASGTTPTVSSDDRIYTGDALMARLNYSLMSRYSLTLSVRRDGYSGFGAQNKRATFPAGALAWTFTEEPFLKSIGNVLNYGKIRLSYGINGNREVRSSGTIDPYVALSQLDVGKYQLVNSSGSASEINTVSVNNRIGNSGLKWEKTASLNFGLDLAFLNNRFTATFDGYDKKTTDLLISQTLPNITGYSNVTSNLAQVSNRGFEASVTSKNMSTKNFSWNTSVNFFLNRNKIDKLATPANDLGNGWFIGKDIDVIWDYKILGVWQADELTEAAKYTKAGIKAGDFKLEDVNGDYLYTDADKQYLGYSNPRFNWSMRNEFNIYKNFDFSFQLVSSWGQYATDNLRKNNIGGVGYFRTNSYAVPYWTPENPINDYARINSAFSGTSFNVYAKSSFIRLNTVALSYSIPKMLLTRAKIQNAKLYVNVANAGVYAPDWKYWDPQNGGPTPRYYTLGLNVSL
ncbi:SusC/RagA family TonB-linked outer membrane protein [Hufsiella ginkgonis]|uniref:SusC/RagA family TonB-linked outer membrane protein n=1 Tax=Hufsiella ginkgonis TaxID=2695274 RepID=A0A7K1XYU5_9SPHI|nr:SusC/RagA family TonB-linked outer membrane protein [Hufsiella ginkgonis]MXV16007.1 SusC/RagA family TonB-linked outer membrane protein [Hufsiella ginkgonis]